MRFAVGVTGHRAAHASYPADDTILRQTVRDIFAKLHALAEAEGASGGCRLTTMLASGADQMAGKAGLELAWELAVPMPFGSAVHRALMAMPLEEEEALAVLAGSPGTSESTQAALAPIFALEKQATVFQLAEADKAMSDLLLQHIRKPHDVALANTFLFETAQRYAVASRIIVEQSDLLVAIWDGQAHANIGGTGHTVRTALHEAVPVLRIDPSDPENWCLLTSTEMLGNIDCEQARAGREERLRGIVRRSLSAGLSSPFAALAGEQWHDRSALPQHAYRRIETLFGTTGLRNRLKSIRQTYETPLAIVDGSARPVVHCLTDLAKADPHFVTRTSASILHRFAWTDGISARLSDLHRSGMILNFLLGSVAIIVGLLYLPLVSPEHKWPFAAAELLVLLLIVFNTANARKRNLHSRWFATRRAAEYLRHRPLMLLAGVARPAGQWPHDAEEDWPERYVRHATREAGLPGIIIDHSWLSRALGALRDIHVVPQRDYHKDKAARLKRTHHALDLASEYLFFAAIIAVTAYLVLAGGQALGLMMSLDVPKIGKWLTVTGVAFPTIGGAIAGIRYFGDFERFADISEVTARRLDEVAARIDLLNDAPKEKLSYADVAELLRTTDEIVMSELQSWQAVFSGKRISVPV